MVNCRILFLDDDENRHSEVVYTFNRRCQAFKAIGVNIHLDRVYSADEAIKKLEFTKKYTLVCLDHDLELTKIIGHEYVSGMAVAEYIAYLMPTLLTPSWVHIHSWNGPAAERMEATIRESQVRYISHQPFESQTRYWDSLFQKAAELSKQ